MFAQGASQEVISTDTPHRPCLVAQTHWRKSQTALLPHVVSQNGGGKRVWTEAAVPPVTLNQRTGNYEVDGLRDCSLWGMGYDAERWSGSVLGEICRYLHMFLYFHFGWCLSVVGIARGVARWGGEWICIIVADHYSVGGGMIHRLEVDCCG